MDEKYTLTAVIMDEELTYSCIEVCKQLNISEVMFKEMEDQGLFKPLYTESAEPFVHLKDINRIAKAWNIHRDLQINMAGVALVLELLDELHALQQHLAILER